MLKKPQFASFRTRFAEDIVAEAMFPVRQTGKVAVIATGAPSSSSKKEMMQFLARQGYVVILPRYRGTWESDGWFLEQSPALDIRDVVTEITHRRSVFDIVNKKKYHVRVSCVHLFGMSFGGPAVILNTTLPMVKKVIALSPVIDWRKEAKDEPFNFFVRYTREGYGGAYRTKNLKDWQKLIRTNFYNPIEKSSLIDGKKIFILHCKDDTIVPFEPVLTFASRTGANYYLKPKGGHRGSYLVYKFVWRKIKPFLDKK